MTDDVVMHHKHKLDTGIEVMIQATFNYDGSECRDIIAHTGTRPLTEIEMAHIITPDVVQAMVHNYFVDKNRKKMRLVK